MAVHAEGQSPTLFELPPKVTPVRSTHVRGRVRRHPPPGILRRLRLAANRVLGRATRRTVSLEVIERHPKTFGGAAVVAGTRVPVFFLEDIYRTEGMESVLDAYPRLSEADVFAALSYASIYPRHVEQDRRRYLSRAAARFGD